MDNKQLTGVRLGMTAPDFSAHTTFGDINLSDYRGRWVILFSHPGDFTPVCTTEFIAFAQMAEEFAARGCYLLGLSIDSTPSHLAWVYNIYETTGITIPFPIISDISGDISRRYGMISPDVSSTETVRNVFFIDPDQKIRAILIYPLTNGRNTKEILRLLDAMQLSDAENVVTPANWTLGKPAMVPPPDTYNGLIKRIGNNASEEGLYCKDWYRCYTEPDVNSLYHNKH